MILYYYSLIHKYFILNTKYDNLLKSRIYWPEFIVLGVVI